MSERVLALVGCGDEKRQNPSEARSLYTSEYFQRKREWAEACDDWRILSAEHGLIEPTTELGPYDTRISDLDPDELGGWADEIWSKLSPLLRQFDVVVVLAGSEYYEPIQSMLSKADARALWPFEGKRIGEQIAWLKNNPPPEQSTFEAY